MKIVVIGGSGLIGRNVVRRLVAQGSVTRTLGTTAQSCTAAS